MFRKILLTAATAVAAIGLAFGSAEAQNKKVKIAYVEWSDAIVATNILKEALASKGYDVTITPLAAAAAMASASPVATACDARFLLWPAQGQGRSHRPERHR